MIKAVVTIETKDLIQREIEEIVEAILVLVRGVHGVSDIYADYDER